MNKLVYSVLISLSIAWVSNPSYAKDYIGGNFQLKDALDTTDNYCFDLFGFGVNLEMNEVISARTCKNPGWPDTTFRVDYPEQGQIYAIDIDLCVQAISFARGAHLKMAECSETNLQRFIYAEDQTVRLRSADNTRELCMVVNPSAGVPMDGAGKHLRREVFMYECGRADLKHAQWMIPEGSDYSPAMPAKSELVSVVSSESEVPGQSSYIAACSRCHGVNAEGIEGMQAPRLAGLSAEYIKTQFYHFMNEVRGSSEDGRWAGQMTYYVKTLPERHLAAVDDIVNYIYELPEPEIARTIPADHNAGGQLYQQQCAVCHGEQGLGNDEIKSPRLSGIQDWYLIKQMQKYRDGRRGVHPDDTLGAQMVPFAKAFSEQDVTNVIAYINQL